MDVTKNRKKCTFLATAPAQKLKYLESGTIFVQTACVEIHQILAPITYIKTS